MNDLATLHLKHKNQLLLHFFIFCFSSLDISGTYLNAEKKGRAEKGRKRKVIPPYSENFLLKNVFTCDVICWKYNCHNITLIKRKDLTSLCQEHWQFTIERWKRNFSLSFIMYFWKLVEEYHSFSLDSFLMGQHKRRKKAKVFIA